ncbi:MAG: hypothetical protein ACXAC5_01705 [Promethearchaeota archaeon]
MNPQDVKDAVKARLNDSVAFTSACISHPLIDKDPAIRHYDVSQEVKQLWRQRQMTDPDGVGYLRTLITVYPDGPSGAPSQAYLYYPDNGFDPNSFTATSRILTRDGDSQEDDAITVTQTANGSGVSKQCQVQKIERTLNIPRFIIAQLGWNSGQPIHVAVVSGNIEIKPIKPASSVQPSQTVDQERRIRLHGKILDQLGTNNPTAMLVEPTTGDKFIQLSSLTATPAPSVAVSADGTDDAEDKAGVGRGISVWDE